MFIKRPSTTLANIKSFGNFCKEYPNVVNSKRTLNGKTRSRLNSGRGRGSNNKEKNDNLIINVRRPVTAMVSPNNGREQVQVDLVNTEEINKHSSKKRTRFKTL